MAPRLALELAAMSKNIPCAVLALE